MKLYEYMIKRNGVGAKGAVKYALSKAEFRLLGITSSKGWPKKYSNMEIADDMVKGLAECALNCKINNSKSVARVETNFNGACNKFLYLLHSKLTNQYKIGISTDPTKRARNISTSSGIPVNVVAYWKVELLAADVEKILHKEFSNNRKIGEWFDLSIQRKEACLLIESRIPCVKKRVV